MPEMLIEDLKPHKHVDIVPRMSPSQRRALVTDIKENGVKDEILVTGKGKQKFIVDGHNRFEAAKTVGLKKVPVRVVDMNDDEVMEYMLRSANFRRHLKDDQRVAVLVEYLDRMDRKRDKQGKYKKGSKTKKDVEREYGFPRHKVDRARLIYNRIKKAKTTAEREKAESLFSDIKYGNTGINKAHNVIRKTKAPVIARKSGSGLPKNLVIGITLETNRDKGYDKVSKAPKPSKRFKDFLKINHGSRMVTIEPILKFDLDVMVDWVKQIKPCMIWMGYDSKNTKLDEPTEEEFRELHWALGREGFPVVLKKAYPGKAKKKDTDDLRKDNMYMASVKQVSPFVGCEHACTYCVKSFQRMLKRQGKKNCKACYEFRPHYEHFDKRLQKTNFKSTGYGEFNFMCQMGDIAFCDDDHYREMIRFITDNSDRSFLLQTKDPKKAFARR